jgi:ketosteroid isomerase-like protein
MAIRTNPSYATAHENLGDVYAKLASQAYSKALQLDGGNTGVQPKLALIRELFAPAPKGSKPTASGVVTATPVAAAPAAPAAAAATKPAATPAAAPPPAAATPAAAPQAAKPAAVAPASDSAEVEAAVRNWAAAWSAKNMKDYLGSYGKEFDPPGSQGRKAWEDERRKRIEGKSRIAVGISNLNVSLSGGKAVAKFKQDYKADSLAVGSRKTLELVKSGDRWVIVKESTG